MKLSRRLGSAGFAVFAAINLAAASSHRAHVFLLDEVTQDTAPPGKHHETIDPTTARLIFADRLSLSDFYDIPDSSQDSLRILNAYGGASSQLVLGSNKRDYHSRIFIIVDGVENAIDLIPSSTGTSFFDIDPAPHPSQNARLVTNLVNTAKSISSSEIARSYVDDILRNLAQLADNSLTHLERRYIVHIQSLAKIAKEHGISSSQYQDHITLIRHSFDSLVNVAAAASVTATVLLAPLEEYCAKPSVDAWNLDSITPAGAKVARQLAEAPLSEPAAGDAAAKPSTTRIMLQHVATSSSSVLSGPIPTCFSSKSACESGTNNCTGHGECVLKFTEKQGETESECYGCMCTKPDIKKNKDGSQKTTYYGGSACQKKDLTMPFWLLTGVTVFIIFIVGWGIGLLYSMGNEELPSVIGAGVSGPKAK